MEAAQIPWRPLGELFVEKGLISTDQLEEALAEQAATGKRLGEILVRNNLISSPELTQTLMEQLGREVAKEEGFGTGLWAEIRRRNGNPDTERPTPAAGQDRGPFGEGLARKLTLAPDEPNGSAPPGQDAEVQELRPSLPQPPEEGVPRAEADPERELLHEAQQEIEVLEQLVSEREQRLIALETEIDSLRSSGSGGDSVSGDLEALRLELEAALTETGVRGARVDELEATLTARDDRIAELQHELAESSTAKREAAANEEELAAARARVGELEAAVSETNDRLTDLEATLAAERDAQGDLRQQLESAARLEEEARQAFSEVSRGLEGLRSERDAARADIAERDQELAALREQLAAAEAARAEDGERAGALEQELVSTQSTQAQLNEELARLREELAGTPAVEQALTAVRGQLADAQAGHEAEAARSRQLQDELQRERDDQAERAREFDDRLSVLSQQLSDAEAALQEKQNEQESLRRESDELRAKLHEAEERAAELESTVGLLDDREEELTRAFADERTELEQRLASLSTELAEASAAHSETRHVLSQALAELSARQALPSADGEPELPQGYVCFTNTPAGYRLVPSFGPLPAAGTEHELDGVPHTVLRIGHSPLPFDSRPCVYLIAAPSD